jgi:N-formylglutamate deformylase
VTHRAEAESVAPMPERTSDGRFVTPAIGPEQEWPGWVVFHAPHASTHIPPKARRAILLDDDELRQEVDRLTDHHADRLLIPAPLIPAAVMAGVSRLVVDVERFLDDDQEPMARVGMGAIYTRASDGRPLRAPPTPEERRELLDAYYHPHHERLTAAVQATLEAYGQALILDLHTFPDIPLPCDLDQTPERPDLCVGTDAFHTPADLRDRVVSQLTEAGFTVTIDRPYAGTIVPLRHLARDQRVASIMIEVNRRLYLQADGVTPRASAGSIGSKVRECVRRATVEWGTR